MKQVINSRLEADWMNFVVLIREVDLVTADCRLPRLWTSVSTGAATVQNREPLELSCALVYLVLIS